jgi:hypothetical protein
MGTSGAFGGSGGKAAKDLRDSIANWLDGAPASPSSAPADAPAEPSGGDGAPGTPGVDGQPSQAGVPQTGIDLRPIIRILTGGGRGGDGPGGGGGGGGRASGGSGGSGRSGGGARRSLGATSRAAGRAGALARAYTSGDRTALQSAGLDYDALVALGDVVSIGTKIVEAAFETRADSTIEDAENREIVADIVTWILDQPVTQQPTPEDIVRKSIELIIADTVLTEAGDRIRQERSREKRRAAEQEIREAAEVYASQVTLTNTGASEQEMGAAIEGGIRELGQIFGSQK